MLYPPMVAVSKGGASNSDFIRLVKPLIDAEARGQIQLRMANEFSKAFLKDLKPNYYLRWDLQDDHFSNSISEILDGDLFTPKVTEVEDTVEVIITTHNHAAIAIRCIKSVFGSLSQNKVKIHVTIADNASTDPVLITYLAYLQNESTVIIRPKDIGYIRNVNDAIMIHPNRDVITLNSDTIVHGNWIDRLRELAYSEEKVATATAFGNHADAYSYPTWGGGPLNQELVPIYDDIVSKVECPVGNTIPYNHGFCSYYKRAALDEIGLFDDNAFELGYGDELDWSFRATERGWYNTLACNVYVGHEGSAIFSKEEKDYYLLRCVDILKIRWPQYLKFSMDWFHRSDPLLPIRKLLDQYRMEKQ